jgi:murein DD-endopeptidase MepM/ murein hydrolase activator NlpD
MTQAISKGGTMSTQTVEIEERLYQRSETKAQKEGKTIGQVVQAYLQSWVGPEPTPPKTVTRTREEIYVVRPGDTLAKIATKMYGDAMKYALIAEHNDITNPGMIRVNQRLRIPFTEVVEVDAEPAGRRFRFPLDKTTTNYYRFGSLYGSGRWAGKPHPGVDFHEYKGANVYAIGEGKVIVNRQDHSGYGHYLVIEHTLTTGEKVWSLYGHLQNDSGSFTTPAAGSLIRGENVVIGKEGETGASGGLPHVHFEIKKTSGLELYTMINEFNMRDYFDDPYTFIRDANNLYVPV